MDFAFYRNFITVAETGNLSAAAKRLGIVQPGAKCADEGYRKKLRRAAFQNAAR